MEQNIFKVVFPQLARDDVMGSGVRTGEENSELHTKITYLSTDLTPIQLVDVVQFSMKIKGLQMMEIVLGWVLSFNNFTANYRRGE